MPLHSNGPVTAPAAAASSSHDRILAAAKHLFATRGYENASTVAIARQAGTSESQLMKHFGNKEGLLEAIFEAGWTAMATGVARAQQIASRPARLRALLDVIVQSLESDPELKQLLLLEGRRIRRGGKMVMMTSGFMRFLGVIDLTLSEMQAAGQLRAGVHPHAVRSALVGMFEGLLRDQVLAEWLGFQADYRPEELGPIFDLVLSCFVTSE